MNEELLKQQEKSLQVLEEERDALRREVLGTREMLFQVLAAVGEPVVVDAESARELKESVQEGYGIVCDYNPEDEAFIFYISKEAPVDATTEGS